MSNEEKLVRMLKYVSEHNDFYKKRIKEYGITNPLDITQWPILTRKELQENRYNMFSDGYKAKYFNQQLRRQTSSGSSGIPINVYWDNDDLFKSNIQLWRRRYKWYGITPCDKCVKFQLNAFGPINSNEIMYVIDPENVMSINVSFLFVEDAYCKIANLISSFKPKWLYIQPSVIKILINVLKTHKHNSSMFSSVKYIESVGEILTEDIRNLAYDYFNAPVANLYGSEEMNGIAYECPEKAMHVLDENVYLEISHGSEQIKSVLLSNLNNKCMPLIRYEQGDKMLINHSFKCLCSLGGDSIKMMTGRCRDTIHLNGGTNINSFYLAEVISKANNKYGDIILQYKYVFHRNIQTLECFVCLDDNYNDWFISVEKEIKSSFQDCYTSIRVIVNKLSEKCVELKNHFLDIVD